MNRPPRVNPFVGVPESSLRFVLLGLVTVAAATYAWQYIHPVLHGRAMLAAIERCAPRSMTDPAPPFRTAYARCWAEGIALPLGNSITLGVLLTVAVVLVCFAVAPAVLRRARRLRTLGPDADTDALRADLAPLAGPLGVALPPVLVDPRPTTNARMIAGGFRRPSLVLGSRLLAAVRSHGDSVRAVLAHELAHVRNADVRLAELAVAAWWTLALAVLAPYVVAAVAGGYPGSVVVVVAKLVAILLLARLLRNALLRAREVDADIRASTVAGVRAPLEDLLSRQGGRTRIWSAHPSGPDRLQRVADPTLALRTAGPDLLALGATAYFLIPGFSFWLEQYGYGRPVSTLVMAGVSWATGAGIGAGLWALAWRAAVAERFTGIRTPTGLRHPAWLAAGLLLGAFVVPLPRPTLGLVNTHSVVQWLTIGAAVFLGCLAVTATARSTARRLVARATDRRRVVPVNLLGLVVVGALAALLLHTGRVFVLYSGEGFGIGDTLFATTWLMLISPATYVLGLLTAVGLLLSAVIRPAPPEVVPDWMVLVEVDGRPVPAGAVSRPLPPG